MKEKFAFILGVVGVCLMSSSVFSSENTAFHWFGKMGVTLSDEEVNLLASKNVLLVVSKFHAGWDRDQQAQDAARLKAANPDVKVLTYYSGRFVFNKWLPHMLAHGFNPEWILKQEIGPNAGQPIYHGAPGIKYVDLSNADYREWAKQYIQDIVNEGGFDGVAFDSARRIGEGNMAKFFRTMLTDQKINAWNQGLELLLKETNIALGENKIVLYNGFTKKKQDPNANKYLLSDQEIVDAGITEDFCLDSVSDGDDDMDKVFKSESDVKQVLETIYAAAAMGKVTLSQVNYNPNQANPLNGVQEYCFNQFLLAYHPGGLTLYHQDDRYDLANSYNLGKKYISPMGKPIGSYAEFPVGVNYRQFEQGYLYVNLTNQDQQILTVADGFIRRKNAPDIFLKAGHALVVKAHNFRRLYFQGDASQRVAQWNPVSE